MRSILLCSYSSDQVQFALSPTTFIYIGFYFILGKRESRAMCASGSILIHEPLVLLNSLLATLNARKRLKDKLRRGPVSLSLSPTMSFGRWMGQRTLDGGVGVRRHLITSPAACTDKDSDYRNFQVQHPFQMRKIMQTVEKELLTENTP